MLYQRGSHKINLKASLLLSLRVTETGNLVMLLLRRRGDLIVRHDTHLADNGVGGGFAPLDVHAKLEVHHQLEEGRIPDEGGDRSLNHGSSMVINGHQWHSERPSEALREAIRGTQRGHQRHSAYSLAARSTSMQRSGSPLSLARATTCTSSATEEPEARRKASSAVSSTCTQ